MQITVEVEGTDGLLARLKAAPETITAANQEAMTKSVFFLEGAVKAGTPRVTGRLFSSIHGRTSAIGGLHGSVSTNVNYGGYVESGRGPIVAKGKALRFRVGGKTIYRRSVGPAAGRYMFRDGLAASAESIKDFFHDAARRAAELIARG